MRSLVRALSVVSVLGTLALVRSASAMDPPDGGAPPPPAPMSCGAGPKDRVLQGVVRQSDPSHYGHLAGRSPEAPIPGCGDAETAPPIADADAQYHYKTHTFMNRAGAASCVTVQLYYFQCDSSPGSHTEACPPEITCEGPVSSGICGGVGPHEVAVHAGAFDPSDIRKNLVAYSGRMEAGPGQDHIEVTIPAKTELTIVVRGPQLGNTVGTGLGYDPYYDLYVSGCNAPATPPSSSGSNPSSSSGGGDSSTSGVGGPVPSQGSTPAAPTDEPSTNRGSGDSTARGSAPMTGTSDAMGCSTTPLGSSPTTAIGVVLAALAITTRRRRR